jgi:hypothetical protein
MTVLIYIGAALAEVAGFRFLGLVAAGQNRPVALARRRRARGFRLAAGTGAALIQFGPHAYRVLS